MLDIVNINHGVKAPPFEKIRNGTKNFSSKFLYIAVLEKRTSHLSHKQKIVGSTPTTATKGKDTHER